MMGGSGESRRLSQPCAGRSLSARSCQRLSLMSTNTVLPSRSLQFNRTAQFQEGTELGMLIHRGDRAALEKNSEVGAEEKAGISSGSEDRAGIQLAIRICTVEFLAEICCSLIEFLLKWQALRQ